MLPCCGAATDSRSPNLASFVLRKNKTRYAKILDFIGRTSKSKLHGNLVTFPFTTIRSLAVDPGNLLREFAKIGGHLLLSASDLFSQRLFVRHGLEIA